MPANALQDSILFYGDNLDILRSPKNYIPTESVDLIYLDPPFNSKADYNILFKEVSGEPATAQIQAFSDFWHWDKAAAQTKEYLTVGNEVNDKIATAADAFYRMLGQNDMTAYLFMMTTRLIELHRVLKPTGSLFLHCDSTASHYLKILLDSIFDARNFRNEIIWRRIEAHSDAKRFGKVADRILFYSKTSEYKFNAQTIPHKKEYLEAKYSHEDERGRYRLGDLNPPGGRGPVYEFRGVTRPWRFTREKMLALDKEGRIYTKSRVPQLKRYLNELKVQGGEVVSEVWGDIAPINSQAKERLGFQTQKPLALLERIIIACSDKGDWVLDPFCGCGTAVAASEKLERKWIGIDITYLAVNLIKSRMLDSFPHIKFKTEGEPKDLGAAKALAVRDRYQFQWWALTLVKAVPVGPSSGNPREGKKGADEGIDGWLRFKDGEDRIERIVVQVKSGHVGVKDIRELRDVISRQSAAMGLFLTLDEPTDEMVKEVKATRPFTSPTWQRDYPTLQILTVEELLKGRHPDIPSTISPFLEAPLHETRNTRETPNWGSLA